ncbi:hypothetical protein RFI_36507, partial [Reticulomyxa filosa]
MWRVFALLDKRDSKEEKKEDHAEGKNEEIPPKRVHVTDVNGQTSDVYYRNINKSQLRYKSKDWINAEQFWRVTDTCAVKKQCTVYPQWRMLLKKHRYTLQCYTQILPKIILPLLDCVEEMGERCSYLIGHGFYRYVFRYDIPKDWIFRDTDLHYFENMIYPHLAFRPSNTAQQQQQQQPEQVSSLSKNRTKTYSPPLLSSIKAYKDIDSIPIVVKITKPHFWNETANWLRHFRESILLQRLQEWEME